MAKHDPPVTGLRREAEGRVWCADGHTTGHIASEELVRLLVEACPTGMIVTEAGGKISLVNAEVERLFGYRREELVGRPIEMFVPPGIRGEPVHFWHALHAHPEACTMGAGRDLRIVRKDGTELPVEIRLNSIRTSEGMMVLGAIIDISVRNRMEAALHRYA